MSTTTTSNTQHYLNSIRALLWRNYIYKKRRPIATLIEFSILPLFFAILVWIKVLAEDSDSFAPQTVPPQFPTDLGGTLIPHSFEDYLVALQAQRVCLLNEENKWHVSGMPAVSRNAGRGNDNFTDFEETLEAQYWTVPFVRCDSRQCEDTEGVNPGDDATGFCEYLQLGVAVHDESDPEAVEAKNSFLNYVAQRYPLALEETFLTSGNRTSQAIGPSFPFVQEFQSEEAIEDYVQNVMYGDYSIPRPKLGGAIVFGSDNPEAKAEGSETTSGGGYAYKIRVNSTGFNNPEIEARPTAFTTPPTNKLFNNFASTPTDACSQVEGGSPYFGLWSSTCVGQYAFNGALTLQRLVQDWVLHNELPVDTDVKVSEGGVSYVYFPSKEYVEEGFYAAVAPYVPLFLVLGLMYPVSNCIRTIVSEKELREKELLLMMSVSQQAIGFSWFISHYLFLSLSGLVAAMVSTQFYASSETRFLVLTWLLIMLATYQYCTVVAAVTHKSTRAVLIGLMVFFIGYVLGTAFNFANEDPGILALVSLHPVAAMSFSFQVIGSLEDAGVGLNANTVGFSDSPSGYTYSDSLQLLIFDAILWGVLGWYLNRVVKGEYGRPQPLHFPFQLTYWMPGRKKVSSTPAIYDPLDIEGDGTVSANDDLKKAAGPGSSLHRRRSSIRMEPVGDIMMKQEEEGTCVSIRGLTKSFPAADGTQKVAVDDLTLNMYRGQVTALLGHNGAGKTTTIGMLTGMVSTTSGYALVTGKDIRTEMNQIRQHVGICLQHDCLFANLTVKEHLQFYSMIKGVYNKKKTPSSDEVDDNGNGGGGVSSPEDIITQAMDDVALLEKQDTLSKNLSGGMKRKLSLAIAFTGNPSVVYLDEPTSGMDPFSRRFTWNVIQQYRANRTIVLTTHFMDEADILGDRIAIMAEGHLRCVGSSLFLKKSYGVGYQLTVEKLPSGSAASANEEEKTNEDSKTSTSTQYNSVEDMLKAIILGTIPEGQLLSNVGTEISYQLPLESASKFQPMLSQLDDYVKRREFIVDYGVSITTLDAVFLTVARGGHGSIDHSGEFDDDTTSGNVGKDNSLTTPLLEKSAIAETALPVEKVDDSNIDSDLHDLILSEEGVDKISHDEVTSGRTVVTNTNESIFHRHVQALLLKRALNFKRDKKAWVCSTIIPSLLSLCGFLTVVLLGPDRSFDELVLSTDDLNPEIKNDATNARNPLPYNPSGGIFHCNPGTCMGYPNLFTVRVNETKESYDYCGFSGIILPLLQNSDDSPYYGANCTITETSELMSIINGDEVWNGLIPEPVDADTYSITQSSHDLFDNVEGDGKKDFAGSQYGAIFFTHDTKSDIAGVEAYSNSTYTDESVLSCKLNAGDYRDSGANSNYCDQAFRGVGYAINTNFTSLHSSILFGAVADEILLNSALQNDANAEDEGKVISITPILQPLPFTLREESYSAGQDQFLAWFVVIFSFPFITGSFGTFIVAERMNKAKHLQTVAGVETPAYWFSSYLWDVVNYQFPLWTVIALMFATGVNVFTTSDRDVFSGTLASLILFGPAAAGFTYIQTFAFKSPSMCNFVVICFNFLIGLAGPLTVFILRIFQTDYLTEIAEIIEWLLRFIPAFCLGKSLFFIINVESLEVFAGAEDLSVWSTDVMLYEAIFLAVEGIVYPILAIYIDTWSTNPGVVKVWNGFIHIISLKWIFAFKKKKIDPSSSLTVYESKDEDVVEEENRVLNERAENELIVMKQLNKVYPGGKVAVRDMTLGIPAGECFGLLGINGAGKTTTMGMLTAEFPPTQGDCILDGYSVLNEAKQTRRRIGYCPQFDAHFANMTGREHVEMYAAIKGVPKTHVKSAAISKLREVGLMDKDVDRVSSTYSGGMKRKLSVACATIGQPHIVFLDEPSTGMDPVARRDMWKVLSNMVNGSSSSDKTAPRTSIILTTHSMEECEALCPRIGIMANGMLRCLGSAQHLKSRFGKGFQVEMKVKNQVDESNDDDYLENFEAIRGNVEGSSDNKGSERFLHLDQVMSVVDTLKNHANDTNKTSSLSTIISPTHSTGYIIYKAASSDAGISIDELADFCTVELRVMALSSFMKAQFGDENVIFRERQDNKVRFEVSSSPVVTQEQEGVEKPTQAEQRTVSISSLFGIIEENKELLRLEDYGVSQTSLEQVFNMHAAAAEEKKKNTID